MKKLKQIFISSLQKQLAEERTTIEESITSDDFLQHHCKPILFEREPPPSRPSSRPYLDTLRTCDVYLLILGDEYGHPDGFLSPVHHEYRLAKELKLPIIVFIKGQSDDSKSHKVREMISEIRNDKITYKRFSTNSNLAQEAKRAIEQMMNDEFMLSKHLITEVPDRDAILRRFSIEFLKHDPSETQVIDYYNWHESYSDWLETGNAHLSSITYKEICSLWLNRYYFPAYESKVLTYKERGGGISRTFIIDNDTITNPVRMRQLCRILKRHIALGLNPKVRRVGALEEAKFRLSINCDTFGTLNGRIAYFVICENNKVSMVRSIHETIVTNVCNMIKLYYDTAHSATQFINEYSDMIPPEDAVLVHDDVALIRKLHNFE